MASHGRPPPGQRGFCSQTPLSPSSCLRRPLWGRSSSRGQGRRASAAPCLREPPLGHAGPSAGRAWRSGAAPASSTDRAGETRRGTWVGSGAWRDGRMRGRTGRFWGHLRTLTFLSFPASVALRSGAVTSGSREPPPHLQAPQYFTLHTRCFPDSLPGRQGGSRGADAVGGPQDGGPRSETGWQLQPEPASRNALPGPAPSRRSAKLCGPGRGDASRRC